MNDQDNAIEFLAAASLVGVTFADGAYSEMQAGMIDEDKIDDIIADRLDRVRDEVQAFAKQFSIDDQKYQIGLGMAYTVFRRRWDMFDPDTDVAA
ncbi:hypothetical protein [Cucumibacter marinus]|uniref:hypothetical protein n=1 Tax=Cucumibacter marinus TaxID=1121252 RepID=UPI00041CEFB5|nr:hypothetical protein [Cucumibacter marinus]